MPPARLLLLVALAAAGCGHSRPGGPTWRPAEAPRALTAAPALLAKLAPGAGPAALDAVVPRRRTDALDAALARLGWVRVPAAGPDTARALAGLPGVVAVAPSRTLRALEAAPTFNDPRAPEQHTLARIDTAGAHAVTRGTARTLLAIVDTGVDHRHPDLQSPDGRTSRVEKGEDYVNLDGDPMDRNGHGTHCAGIAAATAHNGLGIVGQAPGVRLLAVRVLGDNGAGSDAAVAAGIVHAADRGAAVINLSLGGPEPVRVIDDAIAYAQARGALIVAAMGNEGRERRSWPACNEGVLAVGATTASDEVASYSNHGPWISLSAPGDAVLSTLPGALGYGLRSGTSMATPCVAGVAALLRDRHPAWTAAQVRAHLERTADDLGPPGFDPRFGHGRINAGRALRAAEGEGLGR